MESSTPSDETGVSDLRSTGITPKTKVRPPPPPFLIPLNVAFSLCSIAHLLAALNAPVQDCDEIFNYWEPLHYLTHGSGLQTWEYSPEFSIRSWAYILIHAIPTKLVSLLGKPRSFEFFVLRSLLATVCAATETRLYATICRSLDSTIGLFYLLIVASTPGFFYASAAFLPSTFAMYTSTLGLTAFMDLRGGPKTAVGIMWFGIGALLGWPFAGALIIPFVIEDLGVVTITRDWFETSSRYVDGIVRCLTVLGIQVSIDAFFYRKLTVVPWRIVMYNVFSGGDKGPDIFGTEPWHFYVRNLLLNFNLWFILAMSAAPVLAIQALALSKQQQSPTKQPFYRLVSFTTPFYLWFTIFTLQPHKEERFMFPAYPFLALNASIVLHIIVRWFSRASTRTTNDTTSADSKPFAAVLTNLVSKIPTGFKLALLAFFLLTSTTISLLRTLGTVTAYRAPLQIYDPLVTASLTSSDSGLSSSANSQSNVCLAKDWYRFPSSFHLPSTHRPKFIKSKYDGLIPGSFAEEGLGLFPGTWMIPGGMNDRNQEDMAKYIDIRHCAYLVDSEFPSSSLSKEKDEDEEGGELLEPNYISMTDDWEIVKCVPFLDNAATGLLGRVFWVPDIVWKRLPRRVWGRHCLLKATVKGKGKKK